MRKIKFNIHPIVGKENEPTDNNYMLLSYYLDQRKDKRTLETDISELEIVQSGEKTFEEVFEADKFIVDIGFGAGEFECDKDTAYFISNNPDSEPSIEMPLQELIDTLKEWHSFLYS